MSVNIPAIFIAILFLHNALVLYKHPKHNRSLTQILSEVIPRILFSILYLWFFLAEVNVISEISINERGNWVRAGLVYLAILEAIGHWTFIEKRKRL